MGGLWGFGFEYPCLHSPLLTYVGPSIPASFAPLTPDLLTWIEDQTCPVVYVAFGTSHEFTETSCRRLLAELEGVSGIAVLWSLPAKQQALIPLTSSVRLESFVPQYAVLNHQKVSAFVTHCGGNSLCEAILTETPVVCCPGSKDQPSNAARVQSSGAGIIAKNGVAGVGHALHKIVIDLTAYQERVQKLKRVLLSHGGATRAADVIEATGAVGYQHLVPQGQRVAWCKVILGGLLLSLGAKWLQLRR